MKCFQIHQIQSVIEIKFQTIWLFAMYLRRVYTRLITINFPPLTEAVHRAFQVKKYQRSLTDSFPKKYFTNIA